jgi:FkbM family methyltransferase
MTILIGDVATPKLRPDIEHIALPWALRDVTDEQEILKGALFLLKNLYAEGSDHTLIIAKSPYDIPSLQNALDKRESSERVGCAPWRTWTSVDDWTQLFVARTPLAQEIGDEAVLNPLELALRKKADVSADAQTTTIRSVAMQTCLGTLMFGLENDFIAMRIAEGTWDMEIVRALVMMLRSKDEVCIVGAHIGFLTVVAALLTGPEGHVVAFEPYKYNVQLLQQNLQVNGVQSWVTVVPKVCDSESSRMFAIPEGLLMGPDHTLNTGAVEVHMIPTGLTPPRQCEKVASSSVDDEYKKRRTTPKVMVIHAQGNEFAVLCGAREQLEKHQTIVMMHLEEHILDRHGESTERIIRYLESNIGGYTVFRMDTPYPAWYMAVPTSWEAKVRATFQMTPNSLEAFKSFDTRAFPQELLVDEVVAAHPKPLNLWMHTMGDNRGTHRATMDYYRFAHPILGHHPQLVTCRKPNAMTDIDWRELEAEKKRLGPQWNMFVDESAMMDSIREKAPDALWVLSIAPYAPPFVLPEDVSTKLCVLRTFGDRDGGYDQPAHVTTRVSSTVALKDDAGIVPHVVFFDEVLRERVVTSMDRPVTRDSLGIPADALVLGRHGGFETFDVPDVQSSVIKLANTFGNKLHFVFVNTKKWSEDLPPNVHFLPCSTSRSFISAFISLCDGMIHARQRGETFGLSCAEFAVHGKLVLSWTPAIPPADYERNHIDLLRDATASLLITFSASHFLEGFVSKLVEQKLDTDKSSKYASKYSWQQAAQKRSDAAKRLAAKLHPLPVLAAWQRNTFTPLLAMTRT